MNQYKINHFSFPVSQKFLDTLRHLLLCRATELHYKEKKDVRNNMIFFQITNT